MNTVTRPVPADLWTVDPFSLSRAELSTLLEETTGWTIQADTDEDGERCFYMHDPYGDRDTPDFPWYEFRDVVQFVALEIDLALS